MKLLILLLISLSVFGYSTKALNELINSDKNETEKVKELLLLDKELKEDLKKINETKKQYISKYKKIAVAVTKDKNKSNYEKTKAWEEFALIAEGTKDAKAGKMMAYKFSKKANKELSQELKIEELKVDRDFNKIVYILDKILTLDLKNKEKNNFQEKRDLYYSKIDKSVVKGGRSNATIVTDVAMQHPPKKDEVKGSSSNATTVTDVALQHPPKKDEVKEETTVSHKHPLSGKQIQDFRASVYNKETTKIGMLDISNYVGNNATDKKKLLILTFYANYCKPCKKELPFLNKLYENYKDKGLFIVAVNTDKEKDEIKEAISFIQDKNLQYPILKDSYNIISRRYSIENFPTMFLINSEGKILKATIGYDENEAKLENDIINLLK